MNVLEHIATKKSRNEKCISYDETLDFGAEYRDKEIEGLMAPYALAFPSP
jgi:hypothetical protein